MRMRCRRASMCNRHAAVLLFVGVISVLQVCDVSSARRKQAPTTPTPTTGKSKSKSKEEKGSDSFPISFKWRQSGAQDRFDFKKGISARRTVLEACEGRVVDCSEAFIGRMVKSAQKEMAKRKWDQILGVTAT